MHDVFCPEQGAVQADVGILVISARKGEFETGFDRGGQTREHALLAKTLGVRCEQPPALMLPYLLNASKPRSRGTGVK